jgi:hypothetical protein
MKKTIRLRRASWLLSINAVVAILFSGCATPKDHSFNSEFGENLSCNPMYHIQDEDAGHFTITVNEGTPSTGADPFIDLKEAASTIAAAECKRLGWEKWQLDYRDQSHQGWERFVHAEVTREKYVAPTFPQSNGNP